MNEKVAAELRQQIEAERWEAGRKLPSVREIADRFHVSAVTASKALQLLSSWGIVHADSTRGYFVSDGAEAAEGQPRSPEFVAIMEEIAAIRNDVQGLQDRIHHLEQKVAPQ